MKNIRMITTAVIWLSIVFVTSANGTEYRVSLFINGFYFWPFGGGGGPASGTGIPVGKVMATQTYPPNLFAEWCLNDVNGGALENGDQVTFRTAANGLFMCAEGGGGTIVNANRVAGGGWETFTIHKVSGSGAIGHNDQIALQAANGQFVRAENGGGMEVVANRNGIGAWETFNLHIYFAGPLSWTVPAFEPGHWNDYTFDPEFPLSATVQGSNNCYNYGANRETGTNAQPGRASGNMTYSGFVIGGMISSLLSDGWVPTDAYSPSPEGKMRVFIALKPSTTTPGVYLDWHLYRKGSDGMWSHKPGNTVASNLDQSGIPISNPETCNRGFWTDPMGYWFIPTFGAQGVGYANIR
jgi:hypothetical protein